MIYKLWESFTGAKAIIRTADGACIPFDPDNTDYQEYLRWFEAGNTPTSADEPNNG